MSRPALVYISMILALIAGLWLVLEIGRYLPDAPEDLAGKWQIKPTSGDAGGQGGPQGPGLNIEQSGNFFQVAFEHGPQLNLKLQRGTPMVLTNDTWKLTIAGREGGDEKTLQLEGPQAGRWSAHRTVRTFPLDVATAGAK